MPRRRKSGINVGQLVGLLCGIAFLLAIGGFVLILFLGNPLDGKEGVATTRTRVAASELMVEEYLDNASAMRGNAYRVSGRVEEQLRWSPDQGRLVSVVVSSGSDGSPLPILVPPQFSQLNLEKGSRVTFVVEVRDNGLLVATSAKAG